MCLAFSVWVLVVPAVTLGVRGELDRMASSVHICPDGTNPVRGKGCCVVTADSDLCSSVGLFCMECVETLFGLQ